VATSGAGDSARIGQPIITAFADCFTGRETLRTIQEFFGDLEVAFSQDAEARAAAAGSGQRHSRAMGYLASLSTTDPADVDVLLGAIEGKLAEWDAGSDPAYRHDLDRLVRNLERAGLGWDGHRLSRRAGLATDLLPALRRLESVDVDREVARVFSAVESDPADAITAARALIESVCKLVLAELGEPVPDGDELPALYKKTALALRLDPTQYEAVYRQTLSGLVSVVHGLAEVRNRLGDAHGRAPAAPRPRPRHARMAAGAAMTIAGFLAETMIERRATPRAADGS
jgi:hypothetical protein